MSSLAKALQGYHVCVCVQMNIYSSVIKCSLGVFSHIIQLHCATAVAQVRNPIQLMMPIALSLSQGEKRLE